MFEKEYWMSSYAKLKSVKYLAIIGMMIAMKVILNYIRIPVSDNLNIMFTYVPTAVEAMIVGPAAAMVSAVITDLLSSALSGYGPFFAGYTLSKMSGSLIFGLALYRRKQPDLRRIVWSKALVNYIVNVLMGSLWSAIMLSRAWIGFASVSAVKNTILLPLEIAVLYVVLKVIYPTLKRKGIVSDSSSAVSS